VFTFNFHSIYNQEKSFHQDDVYSFEESKLEELLKSISSKKYKVNLTFDDGHLSDLKIVAPLLKKYNLNAVFFVIASEIESNKEKWEQTKILAKMGFEIGSHGLNHVDFTILNDEKIIFELLESKRIIEKCIEKEISFLATPYGKISKKILFLSKFVGYKKLFTTKGHPFFNTDFVVHRLNIKRKDKINNKLALLDNRSFKGLFIKLTIFLKHLLKSVC
jgi:peptidoglycan/xylan/chitin deacetylase (PgdA/CDA1 family)